MLALAFYDVLYFFGASLASDSTSCSSSFCTFSLSTRHFSWWISCVCQHLKIVWESSKSDPANFGRITRHTFALHAAPKMHKCDNFRELFDPLPPSDQCWILCWWSNLCVWQHLSFQHWLGGEGGRDQFLTFMWSKNSMVRSFFIAFLALKWIKKILKFMSYCRQNPTLWPGQSLSSPIRRRFFDSPNGAIRWMHQYVCIRLNTSAYVCARAKSIYDAE